MELYYIICVLMLSASQEASHKTEKEKRIIWAKNKCEKIQKEKNEKKKEREEATTIRRRHQKRCITIREYNPRDTSKFYEYVRNIEITRELFDAMNKEHNRIRCFNKEQLNRKWKMVGTMTCYRDCQHNINCDECGGDGFSTCCLNDGEENHNGMCLNWFISGYTSYKMPEYDFARDWRKEQQYFTDY